MATILSYAELSDAVYQSMPKPKGWSTIVFQASGEGPTQAFQGAAFQKGQDVAIAFKGTSQFRDGIADAKLAVGMNTYQYASAMELTQKVMALRGVRIALCGHSLGGAIAQIVGNRLRLPFVTFNAPGVGLISRNLDQVAASAGLGTMALRMAGTITSAFMHPRQAMQDTASLFYWVQGVNFRLGKDVVGVTGVHYGDVIEIPYTGSATDVLKRHKIGTVIEHLKTSPYGKMQLDAVLGLK